MKPQIVIPMSGFGERFRKAGYNVPKPLIEIDGKPIIAHVIDMFPGETDFLFICNQEHLDSPAYRMREILRGLCPSGRVLGIAPHKLGPVHAVTQALDQIDMGRPVVVNYCDFTCYWDWNHFKRFVAACGCDGAIPAYRGFHPHSLGTTNYAYMREADGWLLDIQEKQPFTDDRMSEYASSGSYYFASGATMRAALNAQRAQDLNINGEYYVSLAYKPMLATGQRVAVYELQHFMQWGTPEDVAEYRMWSDTFRRMADPQAAALPQVGGTTLIPMAGLGERFAKAGYSVTKPLIPVSGRPMVIQAVDDLPGSQRYIFVLRNNMPDVAAIQETLRQTYPGCRLVMLDAVTEGQACTAMLGLKDEASLDDAAGPLTIAACDNGALYDIGRLQALLAAADIDVIVWVARGYPNAARNPTMYGWLETAGERVTRVSVKTPLSDPAHDAIITGTFTFRRPADFARSVERMLARQARVNGEYYIDTCIEDAIALGLNVQVLPIDSYICWGTPNDLRTFQYWQSCFDKWDDHPYRLELDRRVPATALPALRADYAPRLPSLPRS